MEKCKTCNNYVENFSKYTEKCRKCENYHNGVSTNDNHNFYNPIKALTTKQVKVCVDTLFDYFCNCWDSKTFCDCSNNTAEHYKNKVLDIIRDFEFTLTNKVKEVE